MSPKTLDGGEEPVSNTHHDDSWDLSTFDETMLKPRGQRPELAPGLRIGPYAIERELGRGGMGTVYLATRADEAFEKKVAIKVTRGALGSPDALERFRRERQILARLEHPNIARLLDGGATADGLPYLVMEYIDGKPLHAHCDDHKLPTAARLRLFLEVCSAVEYAHHNLIVHRDLKPGNIMVTADGVPRLLDFGIAKLIDPEAGPEAMPATDLALTPWYASPEQIKGEPISTATDVYSLGVVLYELLTGHGPYRLATLTPLEVMKAVVEQEAEAPSAAIDRTVRVTSEGGIRHARLTPFSVSRTREGTPERLRHRLRGDLDAVLMTALRKEPERRYASVAALAADLRSHLAGRPVSARPDRILYRASKFVRRNRWGVLAGVTILGLALGAATNAFVQSRRVTHERDRAARVSRFLVDLFSVSDPGEARGNSVTAREVLDKGAEKIRHDLKEQPEVRSDLMETIADVYNRLGLYDRALALAHESVLFRRSQAQDPRALAQSLNLLGNILMDKGDLPGAEAAYRESLELRRLALGRGSIEVAQSLNNLSSVVDPQGRYDESDRLLQESLEIKRKRLAADDPSLATSIVNLGVNFYRRGNLARAEELLREGLAIQRKTLGEDHPEVAFSMQSVGVILDERKNYDEAEKIYREALAIQRKVLGAEHPDIVTTLTNLANTLSHAGKLAAAAGVYREALSMSEKTYGRETTDTAHVLLGLAELELRQGRPAEALALARESLATREKLLGATHQDVAESLGLVGRVLLDLGRYAEAEATLLRAQGLLAKPEVLESRRTDVGDALRRLYEKLGRPQDPAAGGRPGPAS